MGAEGCELKKSDCRKVVEKLAEVATAQVKGVGKFVLPGVCMIKTRLKPATKAGNLRQGSHGEGEAGEDCCEGLPRFRPEEAILRPAGWPRLPHMIRRPARGGATKWTGEATAEPPQ